MGQSAYPGDSGKTQVTLQEKAVFSACPPAAATGSVSPSHLILLPGEELRGCGGMGTAYSEL